MELKLAALADYASTTDQGKLVIGGVFDTLFLQQFPGIHPQMAVAIRLSADRDEGTKHRVTVRLLDPQGADVIHPMDGDLEFRSAGALSGAGAQIVLLLHQIEFHAEGRYRFEIAVDGEVLGELDLLVQRVAPAKTSRH